MLKYIIPKGKFIIMKQLDKKFYNSDTLLVANDLIGKYLVRKYNNEYIVGIITETEAYIGAIDKACHAYGGKKTKRTQTLYCKGGICYVYFIYGMYYCMNVVTEAEGVAAAVLLRSVEIIEGNELVSKLRYGKKFDELNVYQKNNISNGPGKLCKAMAITKEENEKSLFSYEIFITDSWKTNKINPFEIETGPRIGINYSEEAVDFPWRFCMKKIL